MQISIDNQTALYIKTKLKGDTWWCATKIIELIDRGFDLEKTRSECKHKWGKYKGKKECCVYCGTYDIGMGEEWTLE